jgi:hypothetical protein
LIGPSLNFFAGTKVDVEGAPRRSKIKDAFVKIKEYDFF